MTSKSKEFYYNSCHLLTVSSSKFLWQLIIGAQDHLRVARLDAVDAAGVRQGDGGVARAQPARSVFGGAGRVGRGAYVNRKKILTLRLDLKQDSAWTERCRTTSLVLSTRIRTTT